MKIFMLCDMEGVSGLFTREQVWYWEEGARPAAGEQGRALLMADIHAMVAGLLDAGVDELIVCDTHHGGGNIRLDAMLADSRVTYLQKPRGYHDTEFRWLPGLDGTVDAFLLPGHHAKACTENAFLPHTWTCVWTDFRINGRSVGEIGIETCFAGYWDVPLAFVQGTELACREAEALCPGVVTAAVKRAKDHDTCVGLEAEAGRRLTVERIVEAVEKVRAGDLAPYKPALPMTVSIRMKSAEDAEAAAAKPGAQRTDEYTVEGHVETQADVVKWIIGTGLQMEAP
ncbi:MAG: M55 family metallopeptidase [Kiritimatiellae bacterium]|nr:M55 family metallopeptidase [Kiritimatiellia bacterium]